MAEVEEEPLIGSEEWKMVSTMPTPLSPLPTTLASLLCHTESYSDSEWRVVLQLILVFLLILLSLAFPPQANPLFLITPGQFNPHHA